MDQDVYLKVRFIFDRNVEGLDEQFLENIVTFAIISMYGHVGGSLLQYCVGNIDLMEQVLEIQTNEEDFRKIAAALALLGYYASARVKPIIQYINADNF